eukprot:15433389-Alexandrium_andersonii.AAC.1
MAMLSVQAVPFPQGSNMTFGTFQAALKQLRAVSRWQCRAASSAFEQFHAASSSFRFKCGLKNQIPTWRWQRQHLLGVRDAEGPELLRPRALPLR